jgi:hypothetical protein
MNDAILYRYKMAIVGIEILFGLPSDLTVVEDIVFTVLCPHGILRKEHTIRTKTSYAETQITHNEILGAAEFHFVVRDYNAHSGSGLACKREILSAIEVETIYQANFTCYGKANSQWFTWILLDCPAERAFSLSVCIIGKRRNIYDLTATSTRGVLAETFCAGESNDGIRQ